MRIPKFEQIQLKHVEFSIFPIMQLSVGGVILSLKAVAK